MLTLDKIYHVVIMTMVVQISLNRVLWYYDSSDGLSMQEVNLSYTRGNIPPQSASAST